MHDLPAPPPNPAPPSGPPPPPPRGERLLSPAPPKPGPPIPAPRSPNADAPIWSGFTFSNSGLDEPSNGELERPPAGATLGAAADGAEDFSWPFG